MLRYHGLFLVDYEVVDLNLDPITLSIYVVLLRLAGTSSKQHLIDRISEKLRGLSGQDIVRGLDRLEEYGLISGEDKIPGKDNYQSFTILSVKKAEVVREEGPIITHVLPVMPTPRKRGGKYKKLIDRDGERCRAPGCAQTNSLTIDHIVPRKYGGSNDLSNLHLLCKSHNSEKRDRSWEWFLERHQQVES